MSSIGIECYLNSSSFSWGAYFGHQKIGGACHTVEKELHINPKELFAWYYFLRCLKDDFIDSHAQISSDSQRRVMKVNKMEISKNSQNNSVVK